MLNRREKNLLNLYRLSFKELTEISGIGKVKAIQLKCLAEITRRMTMATRLSNVSLNSASAVAAYYMEEVISVGTINASLISPREIFKLALMNQAVYIILLHNHPSGDPVPSTMDRQVTHRVEQSGEMLGIHLSDHIIIGDNKYFSFKEENLLLSAD